MMKSVILAVAVVVVMFWNGAAAQSGCTVALLSLSPCISYVSGNSSSPSSSCCSSLSNVVVSQPLCLCSLLNGGASNLGITVNQTLALALPSACNLKTPPVSRCDAANGPSSAPAPADSPSGSTAADDTPEAPTTPSSVPASGSKTVPTRNDGSANAGSNVGATAFSVAVLMMASTMLAFS